MSSEEDPVAVLYEVAAANRQTAACLREVARSQDRGTEAMRALGRAVREVAEINLRCAANIAAICDPVLQINRYVQHATATAQDVATSLQEQEQKLRRIITPVVIEEPATLSLTSDAVAFTPEADERIVRKILALEPEKPTFN